MYEMLETLHVTLIRVDIQDLHTVRYTIVNHILLRQPVSASI